VLAEGLIALASLAGNTVVVAATTDAWEAARHKFARLLGRGNPDRTEHAERRLAQTHQQLEGAAGQELEKVKANLERAWQVRLEDLLEEDPSVEAELRALVEEIRALLPSDGPHAADHAVATGRDTNITASGNNALAAGVIHGNVSMRNPTRPGPERSRPDPE
jgi:hypothetical protein